MAQFNYWPRYGPENYSVILPLEDTFDPEKSTKWMQDNWHISFTSSIAYVAAIFLGREFMKSREALKLETPLFLWNLGLAVFSILGFVRMTPEWAWSWFGEGNSFTYSVCTASYAQGVTGFWTEQFAMSKIAEFVDTAFIVLRKRKLIFLHWYHHVTVLIYTWHAYKDHTASGRWFIWMNYGVHGFMYSYYALAALKIRLPKAFAMLITTLQISQMVMGVLIGVVVYGIKSAGGVCQQSYENLAFCFTIYFTYFLLFCNFFYNVYLKKNNRYTKPVVTKKTTSTDTNEDKKEELLNEVTEGKEDINANITLPEESAARPRRRVQKAD